MQLWMILANVLGIAVVSLFSQLPSASFSGCIILVAIVSYFNRYTRVASAFLLGVMWAVLYGHQLLEKQLPEDWQGKELLLTGVVQGLPDSYHRGAQVVQRFDIAIQQLCHQKHCRYTSGLAKLSWYESTTSRLIATQPVSAHIQPGQTLRLLVKLKQPWGSASEGSFDYQSWLISRGFVATGYVRHSSENALLSTEHSVDLWRWRLAETLDQQFSHLTHLAFIKALLLGDKRDVTQQQWETFKNTGAIHLLIISGLHIGLIAALAFYVGRLFCFIFFRHQSPEMFGSVFAIVAALFYAAMAGFSLPTQRALIMVCVWMMATIYHRNLSPVMGLLIALWLCLLLDPLAVTTASFWLSFAAVAVILYGVIGRKQKNHTLMMRWISQYLVFIGLMPVMAVMLAQISVLTPIANLILLPIFSFIIVPLNFIAVVVFTVSESAGGQLWQIVDWLLSYCLSFLQYLSNLRFSVLYIAAVPKTLVVLSVVAVIVLLLPRGIPGRWLGLLLLLPIILYEPERPAVGEIALTVLDVGQGLSVVVETHQHTLVYDLGPAFSETFTTAQSTVLPYLRSRGINQVDHLMISHNDLDHAGAWQYFLNTISVQQMSYGETSSAYPVAARPCRAGDKWQWDGVQFEVVFPDEDFFSTKSNNQSCVLLITAGQQRFLLTGDIEGLAEGYLLRQVNNLVANVVVAPHHGSTTSSSQGLVTAVNAEHVVFASGYRNRFRHPRPQVVKRYRDTGAAIHCTCIDGTVSFVTQNDGLAVKKHRFQNQRYWLPLYRELFHAI